MAIRLVAAAGREAQPALGAALRASRRRKGNVLNETGAAALRHFFQHVQSPGFHCFSDENLARQNGYRPDSGFI